MAPDGRALVAWINAVGRNLDHYDYVLYSALAGRTGNFGATKRRLTLGGTDSSAGFISTLAVNPHPLIGYYRSDHVYLLRLGGKPKQFARGDWIELQGGLAIYAHTPRRGHGRVYVDRCC